METWNVPSELENWILDLMDTQGEKNLFFTSNAIIYSSI